MGLRKTLRKIFGYKEINKFLNNSYSQEGEDMILYRLFEHKKDGRYVDVGAHHPILYSNTYKFYQLGWRGVNIDAMPGAMEPFKLLRSEDINIECPVANVETTLPFYIFNETALNTLSKDLADERSKIPEYKVTQIVELNTRTLGSILHEHFPDGTSIDFLTIDAEGLDDKILRSNDWKMFRPSVVLFESELSFDEMIESGLHNYLREIGYLFFAKTVRTYFYKEQSF